MVNNYLFKNNKIVADDYIKYMSSCLYFFRYKSIRIINFRRAKILFICSDQNMSSRALVDENGNKDQTRDYPDRDPFRNYPYGETEYAYGDKTKYQFSGKGLDATGLCYFGARYYQGEARPLWGDPEIGTWLTCDPAGQFHSLCSYCPDRAFCGMVGSS